MLTLTENATTLIKNLADQTAVADAAGLRITAEADSANLSVDLTPCPRADRPGHRECGRARLP